MSPQPQHPSRRRFLRTGALGGAGLLLGLGRAAAHPGSLDEFGGHFDERTGLYHYHDPKLDVVRRKKQYLEWLTYPDHGAVQGVARRVDAPDAVWVEVPYRPAYQELIQHVERGERDDQGQLIRVWFLAVNARASLQGHPRRDALMETAVFELRRKLADQQVSVQFQVIHSTGTLRGFVFLGQENVNLWIVLNGWSYYFVNEGDPRHEERFTEAEGIARREGAGVWSARR